MSCPGVGKQSLARSNGAYLSTDHSLPHPGQVGVALGEAGSQVGQVVAEVAPDAPRQIVVTVRNGKHICVGTLLWIEYFVSLCGLYLEPSWVILLIFAALNLTLLLHILIHPLHITSDCDNLLPSVMAILSYLNYLPIKNWILRKHPQSPLVTVFRRKCCQFFLGSGSGVSEAETETEEEDDDAKRDGEHDEVSARVNEVVRHI